VLKPIQSPQSRHESSKLDAAREAGGCPPCALAYTALFKLTGYLVATFPMRIRDDLLPAGLQIIGYRGHDNEVIETAIEVERRNAESKEDKDERDGAKNKPDPV
jgi:Asp-tRNA(Asn)/Glu-tRNA(Gln) amidotransferase A subunit family amidase